MVKSRSNSLWFCWMSYLLRILGGILNRSNSKITLGKSSNNTWIFYGQSDRKRWPPHTHLTVSFSWFFWVVYFWPQIINICVLKWIFHKKRAIFWMIICKSRPLRIIICKRPVPLDDHLIADIYISISMGTFGHRKYKSRVKMATNKVRYILLKHRHRELSSCTQ